MGRYRLHVRGEIDPAKQYLVQLEYTWNRQVIRKGMNIFVRLGDWNEKANKGRGGVRASYGPEANRINSLLLARVDKIDSLLAEFQQKHPNQITEQVISDLLADKPLTREDKGKDFIEFVQERLESDYSRNRIGRSRYENGKSGMNIFRTFLRATKNGTYKPDSIYLGEISVELIDEYIRWRREIKQNSDATINHALTPILKACAYASEMKMMPSMRGFRICVSPQRYLSRMKTTSLMASIFQKNRCPRYWNITMPAPNRAVRSFWKCSSLPSMPVDSVLSM